MKAKDVIKGIEEGFDDNEQIADAVEWVGDAASRLAEFEQDNHMQSIEIEKLKAEIERLKAAQEGTPCKHKFHPMNDAGELSCVYCRETIWEQTK